MNLVNTNYSNRCTILTGPNGSGKTVYLKQISLIIYLAHCGLFVPAGFA
jgi:DNA mismatch repair protein MSH5